MKYLSPKVGELSFNSFITKHLDYEDVDMKAEEWIDPLCPSAVLVSYLNELPSSLIPPDKYEKFIGIAGKIFTFFMTAYPFNRYR